MIRLLLSGLWVCILTAGASYAVAFWKETGSLLPQKEEYIDGLQYHKTRVLSVPMIENGSVQGYIITDSCTRSMPGLCSNFRFPPIRLSSMKPFAKSTPMSA